MPPDKPFIEHCRAAIKILMQYERLASKYRVRINPERLSELNRLRDNGQITVYHLPGTLRVAFPGEFIAKTLGEIRKLCEM
ncbi:MAG: hypothetical protein ACYDBJ_07615 [Aggregatilineales bacterium]